MSEATTDVTAAPIEDVRSYWESNPLYSYETDAQPGDRSFFDEIDEIKRNDVEKFSMHYWEFEKFRGKKVLDIGCGPGWLTVQYAKAGAHVTSVDLTDRAVELTKKHLAIHDLTADVRQANAEELPFEDETFDLVVSSGVLHHTSDTVRAVQEAQRVCKDEGDAKITFYHKGLLHSRALFPIVQWAMRRLRVKHPGADLASDSQGVDDFIRMYDGADNPIGRGYSTVETRELFQDCGFQMQGHELAFFPVRFVPNSLAKINWVHKLLDRRFGTMIYPYLVRKNKAA